METDNHQTPTVTLRPTAPTVTGFMGDRIAHPEFVGVGCDGCDASGYVSEGAAMDRDDGGCTILCADCDGEAN